MDTNISSDKKSLEIDFVSLSINVFRAFSETLQLEADYEMTATQRENIHALLSISYCKQGF